MKIAFYTLGCKVNQYDTQMMTEKCQDAGYTVVDFDELADVYVINTCTVTQMSDKKSRNMISRAKRRNPNCVLVVCGCFSQVAPDKVACLSGVDIVIGTRNRPEIVRYISEFIKSKNQIIDVKTVCDIECEHISRFSEKTRAIIKIEDGCRNFCSYCLISFARGKIVSKPLSQVVSEAKACAEHGYREVVLTGIHLSSYGRDLDGVCLADAIESVAKIDGIERIRLGSLEPTVITEEFVKRIKKIGKLCPQFHLSLQSGCDKTLVAMNRKYTANEYFKATELLKKSFEDCALTTDIIVGFPQESDADFEESLDFADKVGFAKIHIFPYSIREGTKAAKMDGQITKQVKSDREKRLAEVEKKHRTAYLEAFVGKRISVLCEECENGKCNGFSIHYVNCIFDGDDSICGKFVEIEVVGHDTDNLLGKIVTPPDTKK